MQLFTQEQEKIFVEGLKAQNEEVFNKFYKHTFQSLKAFLLRRYPYKMESDLEDILQEVYIKIWKKASSFDSNNKLSAWIYKIVINTVIDKIVRNRYYNNCTSLNAKLEVGEDFECIKSVESNEKVASQIQELKNCLGERHLAVFNVVFEQGKQFKEASKILNIPLGTVQSRSYYLKRKLQEKLS